MTAPDRFAARNVLAVPDNEPERLFSGPDQVAAEYRQAALLLHPDRPGGHKAAFQHLGALHAAAEARARRGEWRTPGLLVLRGEDGSEKRLRFRKEFDAGAGRGFIGQTLVTFLLPEDLADLADNARTLIDGFERARYPSDEVRRDIEFRRPRLKRFFRTADRKAVLMLEKPEDVIRLRDAADHFGGQLNPRHVWWIVSELCNLSCWLEHAGLSHNDISMDSVFISPSRHTAMILGGWFFAASEGARMQRVQTARTVAHLPRSVLDSKQASIKTDLALIRLLGRELLGDPSGVRLAANPDVAPALAHWLRIATTGQARRDYRQWSQALTDVFGEKRRFAKLDLHASDIYKEA